jgi:hypothetical protein
MNSILKTILITLSTLFLISCQSDDLKVEVYKVKKSKILAKDKMALNNTMKKQNLPIGWKTPKGWIEKVGNSIRIGSFSLPSIKEKKAELSIIVLAGSGGGIVPNINRWRGQIGLDSLTEKEVKDSLISIKGNLGQYFSIYMENNEVNKAITSAFIMHKGKTIFIKAMGHPEVLKVQKKTFISFTKGIYEN